MGKFVIEVLYPLLISLVAKHPLLVAAPLFPSRLIPPLPSRMVGLTAASLYW